MMRSSRQGSPAVSDLMETRLLLGRNQDSDDNQCSDVDERKHEYDEALKECGYGKFHYWFLLVCGWANASDAVEIICISFLLPSAQCDLDLTSQRKGWLTAILFIGMMIGGYMWGSLGDTLGRRLMLIYALLVTALAGIGSSLAQEYFTFLTCRFAAGVGVGGSIPVVWAYFGEFQPSHRRGSALSLLASFWMVGNVTVAAMAWAIIPHELGIDGPDVTFKFNSWRIFTALCALPSLFVAISLMFLPESPKFLLSQGRHAECLQVLKKMYTANTGKSAATFPILEVVNEHPIDHETQRHHYSTTQVRAVIINTIKKTAALFNKSLFRVTIIMIVINFAIQFGYYGLWLWFPELFDRLSHYYKLHPDDTISVCEVIEKSVEVNQTIACGEDREPTDDWVFINSFIISFSSLPSNLWTIVHMDKLGRKFFLCLSMILSGASAFLIYLVNSQTMNLILNCIFGAVSTMGFNSLDCLGIELFPTDLRGTAMAVTLVSARLGAILGTLVFGYLLDIQCAIPIIMVAVLLIGGGLLGLLLPNTTKQPLM